MVDLPLSRVYMYPFSCQGHYYLMFRYLLAPVFRGGTIFSRIGLFKGFHGNDFCGLRILVSHAQSDAAAGAA